MESLKEESKVQESPKELQNETLASFADPQRIESLSNSFLHSFHADLKSTEEKLNDIEQNQRVLIESVCQESSKLQQSPAVAEIESSMKEIELYRSKLIKIKRTMISLKDTSRRLRRDALKVQQLKEKENLKREEIKKKQLAEENKLAATLST